jgi:hypothetical protein
MSYFYVYVLKSEKDGNNWFFHGTPDVGWANFSTGYKMIINIHP